MSSRDRNIASRVFDFCVGTLLASMALWGAVEIVTSIWVALCLGVLAIATATGLVWILTARFRRW